jgi:hypothetical protein
MSKILRNDTGSAISISDTGVTIQPGVANQYTIPPVDYLLWAESSDVIVEIGASNLVVNDGSNDLSISNGTDLIKGLFPKKQGVTSGDDFTDIGHVDDKLKVDTTFSAYPNGIPVNIEPANFIRPQFSNLLNGSSKQMNVDGSSTPVEFLWEPTLVVHVVKNVTFTMGAPGDPDSDQFASLAALTNGLKFEIKSNGTVFEIYNMKDNKDVTLFFSTGTFSIGNTADKWMKDAGGRFFVGSMELFDGVKLDPSAGDYIKVTVRDDISSLLWVEAGIFSWRDG